MSITDLTPDFFAFWQRAEGLSQDEQYRLWYEFYEDPHHDLFSLFSDRHGTCEALPAALARFPEIVPRLREDLPLIRAAVERTGPEIAALFALERLDFRCVLLVGMFWSDGWVVEVDGHPTCSIAVEMIGSSPRVKLLLSHEAAHFAHAMCFADDFAALDTLGGGLFSEGLATLASAQIDPDREETTYLWSGLERTRLRGLSMPEWLAQCEASWPTLRSQLMRDLASAEPKVSAPYFLGDQAPPELPECVGYFVGLRLVSGLVREHSIAELARWPAARVQDEMARALAATEEAPPRFHQASPFNPM